MGKGGIYLIYYIYCCIYAKPMGYQTDHTDCINSIARIALKGGKCLCLAL